MSEFGRALKPVDVDKLIDYVRKEVNKPYKPKRTSLKLPEIHTRKRKKTKIYSKRHRELHGYTVFYDRNRKGWFFRDEEGNRHGFRGSLDKGYASKKKAIDAAQRYWRKKQKEKEPPIPPDYPDPDPCPVHILPDVIVEYDAYCNKCRRDCYGSKAPSGSLYLEFFNNFEEDKPRIDIAGWSRTQMEEKDSNFSITLMLSYQGLKPVYEKIQGTEMVVGLEDL